ncbi:MAG: hypothetical protein AAFY76_23500, partial [Cyanobacteria bacterium J06649_11]
TVTKPVVKDTPSDDNSTETTSSPDQPPPQPTIDMEAKIVVNKLPNKRKRTLPTARRTGHKKRRTETGSDEPTSKENITPATTTRGRRNSIAGTRTLDKQMLSDADDVFNFSKELKKQEKVDGDDKVKPVGTLRRSSRSSKEKRKSLPTFFKTNTKSSTVKNENEVEDKKKDVPVRPVPQLDNMINVSDKIDSDDDEKPLKLIAENKKVDNQFDSQEKVLDDEILAIDVDALQTKVQTCKDKNEDIVKKTTKFSNDEVKNNLPKPQLEVSSLSAEISLSSPSLHKNGIVSSPLSRSLPNVSSPLARNRVHVSSPLSRNVFSVSSPLSRNREPVLSSPVSSKQHNVCSRTSSPVSSKIVDDNKL